MKILILGKNGQVGWELNRTMLPLGDIIALDYPDIDFSKPDTLRTLIREIKPDVIANAVAYTAVDRAEDEEQLAHIINADAPALLADIAKKSSTILIHYSTDYVFDGTKKEPYTETDQPNPLNAYGRTKLVGDLAVQASGCKHFIFRTSWVFGARGQNFLLTMLRLAKERKELKIVDDQIGAPTWSRLIAETTSIALAKKLGSIDSAAMPWGLYNLTASGATSWYGFAQAIFREARLLELIPPDKMTLVMPLPSSEYKFKAVRPLYSVLSNDKMLRTMHLRMPSWEECFNRSVSEVR